MNHRETQHHERRPPPEVRGKAIVLVVCAIGLVMNGIALLRIGFPDLVWGDVKVTDWLLVVVGITYTLVTAFQLRAMNRTVESMRESTRIATDALDHARESAKSSAEGAVRTANLTLRAYVGMEEAAVEWVDGAGYWVRVIIKNAGSTPALDVDCLGGLAFGFYPELGDYTPTMPGARAVLMPGGTLRENIGPIIQTEQEAVWTREGTATLYAFGTIRYTDFFGVERITNYRVMALPDDLVRHHLQTPQALQMVVCRKGNSVT